MKLQLTPHLFTLKSQAILLHILQNQATSLQFIPHQPILRSQATKLQLMLPPPTLRTQAIPLHPMARSQAITLQLTVHQPIHQSQAMKLQHIPIYLHSEIQVHPFDVCSKVKLQGSNLHFQLIGQATKLQHQAIYEASSFAPEHEYKAPAYT